MMIKITHDLQEKGVQFQLYGIMMASYNCDIKQAQQYLSNLTDLVDDFGPVWTYTALIKKCYDVADLLIRRELEYLNNMYGGSTNRYDI